MRALLFSALLFSAVACKTPTPVMVPLRTTTSVQARPITVSFQPDSLALSALFTCDSNYNVVLNDYNELFSDYMNLQTSFQQLPQGGMKMQVNAIAQHPDTVIIVHDSITIQEVPLFVPGVPTKQPLTWLQRTLIYSGIALWAFVIIYILTRFFNPLKLKRWQK